LSEPNRLPCEAEELSHMGAAAVQRLLARSLASPP